MKLADQFQAEFRKNFLDREFLTAVDYTERQMETLLDRCALDVLTEELMETRLPDGRFHAQFAEEVLQSCIPVLEDAPEDGWAESCRNALLGKLFPGTSPKKYDKKYRIGMYFYLQALRGLYRYERKTLPFSPRRDFSFLTPEEQKNSGSSWEYRRMREWIRRGYIYEFMRLGADITPYDTIAHVAGVHYVSMYLGRQIAQTGIPINLAILSGAATVHDIGKYGCREGEEARVPYLHYYYTDWCCRENGLLAIGHIAANHSVWDLELENLSIENLILIYADFRVKACGSEAAHFYPLDESYQVILDKLDNVDDAKRARYAKVYAKLADFEKYLRMCGIRTELPAGLHDIVPSVEPEELRDTVLLDKNEVAERYKFKAIDHNIRLMSSFLEDRDFSSLIEAARSEQNWKDIRTYISILEEYSTYMTERQKQMTLQFLYELLLNREGDIRLAAASLMGRLIARFPVKFTKELPSGAALPKKELTRHALFEEYIKDFFFPDIRYSDQFRRWINWRIPDFVHSFFKYLEPEAVPEFLNILEPYFMAADYPEELMIASLHVLDQIPEEMMTDSFKKTASAYIESAGNDYRVPVRIALAVYCNDLQGIEDPVPQLRRMMLQPKGEAEVAQEESSRFLADLKTGTHWILKVANIRIMMDDLKRYPNEGRRMHLALHLANILKVSDYISVRRAAGDSLLKIADDMEAAQRNELAVEIYHSLKLGDPVISHYGPEYLGQLLLKLSPKELDEMIASMKYDIMRGSAADASPVIATLGAVLERYGTYPDRFYDTKEGHEERERRMLYLMLKAVGHYDRELSRDALRALGQCIYRSRHVSLERKDRLFAESCKKQLVLMEERTENTLDFYSNAAFLNNVYRYLGAREQVFGKFSLPEEEKVCFYPGTFDPFSLGHKEVARQIRDLGFSVYLSLDEFSWSKHTQARLTRRAIMSMSVAEEENIYPFPDGISINIANPEDIARLKEMFAGKELYLAVGTDVIENASAYKAVPEETSVHTLNHIAFERETDRERTDMMSAHPSYPISGKVLTLKLGKFYEDISSTQIRDNVDRNRDISNLTDPVAAGFIYDNDLYLREPAYKHVIEAQDLLFSELEPQRSRRASFLLEGVQDTLYDIRHIEEYLARDDVEIIHIEQKSADPSVIGCAAVKLDGKKASIGYFYTAPDCTIENIGMILLTELLSKLTQRGFKEVIYEPADPTGYQAGVIRTLEVQGFRGYRVSLEKPVLIFRDVESIIKNPFQSNKRVRAALSKAHLNLLKTLRDLYPGTALLSYSMSAIHHKMIAQLAYENDVPLVDDRKLMRGPYMAVPFGKVLHNALVPNTVTKQLNIEKYFSRAVKGFRIDAARNYSSIDDQMKTIHSFMRPVILVDDLMHKGFRIQGLLSAMKNADVELKEVLTGVMTGNGKALMDRLGISASSLYYIPEISVWLNERDCYPFIGGDSIDNPEELGNREREASINLLLPYVYPEYIARESDDPEAAFRFSMTCLTNARQILETIQEVYQEEYSRKLTLERLGEVFSVVRVPEIDVGVRFDENLEPSIYLQNEIEQLIRMRWGSFYEQDQ